MRLASWNVNSLRVRLPQVLDWLSQIRPDVLALQETKLTDDVFPVDRLAEAGYQSVFSGQKTYNGVALLTRDEVPADVVTGLGSIDDPQRRIIAATVGGVRVYNVYVPNGQAVGSDKYDYKLRWLATLRDFREGEMARHENLVVIGDFNIAPADEDVYDAEKWGDAILCSPKERAALGKLIDLGLTDVFRKFEQPEKSFSWWDYRAAGFRRNAGLRIDLILTSDSMTERCSASFVDKEPRAWERPSDHAPVVAEFAM